MIPKLTINPSNPRIIKKKQYERLLKSLESFTKMLELRPIIYDENNIILGGNMRYQALTQLASDKKVELKDSYFKQVIGYTEAEKKEFVIRDNVELGDWDMDILANEWSDLPLDDWGIDLQGWGDEVVEDDAPEVSKEEPVSKLGEVYQLGRHRLMCGDSTKIEDVVRLMNGQKADMVFTDPPYGVNYAKKNKEILGSNAYTEIENDNLSVGQTAKEIWKTVFDNLAVFSKDHASIYVTMPQGGDQMMMMMMMMMDSWKVKHELIWVKPSPVFSMGRLDYDYKHEPILYGWKKTHRFFGKGKYTKSVWEISRDGDKSHPTMKPVELIANCLMNSTEENDIVLDLFGGSGSTLIACEQLNRTCYMMELDPKYCDVIRKRYAKFIGEEDSWQEI